MKPVEPTFAEQVAVTIRSAFPEPAEWNGFARLFGVWTVGPDRVVIVYSGFRPGVIGLDIQVEPARGLDNEVERVLRANVCEPLGTFADSLSADEHGVQWWSGEPAEWF